MGSASFTQKRGMGGSWAGKEEEISLAKDAKGAKKRVRCFELLRDLGEREIIRTRREGAPPERTYFDRITGWTGLGSASFTQKRGMGRPGKEGQESLAKDAEGAKKRVRCFELLGVLGGLGERENGQRGCAAGGDFF